MLYNYFPKLKQLAKDCNYQTVNTDVCQSEAIHNAFISGLVSMSIRYRLLENKRDDLMTLDVIYNQALYFDMPQKSLGSYTVTVVEINPISALESCKTKLAKVVESSCFKKTCDACGIQ